MPGVSGLSSICTFFPTKAIEWFRETERCYFYFKNTDAVKKDASGNITGFKSHTKSNNDAQNINGKYVTMKNYNTVKRRTV